MKKITLFFILLFSYGVYGQSVGGSMLTISNTVPTQLNVCSASGTFTVGVNNTSTYTLQHDTLKVTMPTGMVYQPGSISGATESNISVPNAPVFLLANIAPSTTSNITFKAAAECSILPYLLGGASIKNNIYVAYTGNGSSYYQTQATSSYGVTQPNLSVTHVSNATYSGNVGDIFTRCITITNGGAGALKDFTFTDAHGSGVEITGITIGQWTHSSLTDTVKISGGNFLTVGNGDSLLQNSESITICETVKVLSCDSVASVFDITWGCDEQNCQSATSNANVVFPDLIPVLTFSAVTTSMNSCVESASPQKLRIVNTGIGTATNVQLDIYQTDGVGYGNNVGSYIDTSSFKIQYGALSIPVHIKPDSTVLTATLHCMVNPIGKVTIPIPVINSGDTVYISWNTYSCCYNSCTHNGNNTINGWNYSGRYGNICQNKYLISEGKGRDNADIYGNLYNNNSPATLLPGQTGTFNFEFSNYTNSYTIKPGAYWKFVYTIPQCLSYVGNLNIVGTTGAVWLPDSIVSSPGNIVTAYFAGTPPWTLEHAQILADLKVTDCSACTGFGAAVDIQSFFIPDTACTCAIGVSCTSATIDASCPPPCTGLFISYFGMNRTNYGLPDNEPGGGDGIPDATGGLNLSLIRTDRAMFGDTITQSFNGLIITQDPLYPYFQYCFASSSMTYGTDLTFLDATFNVYRNGINVATFNNFTPYITTTAGITTYKFNLSIPTLGAGNFPAGYEYINGDSLVFKPRYKVTTNTGGPILDCYSTTGFFVSDIPNPVGLADSFQCNPYNAQMSLIGYFFKEGVQNAYFVNSCDSTVTTHSYELSIGPCCNNYAGGNMFPYEYRNWAHIDTITQIIPPGYTFVSAMFNQKRTAGNSTTNTSAWIPITPINPNSDTLVFLLQQYFQGYGGTIPLSDDGFSGVLHVTLQPSCKVTPYDTAAIPYIQSFSPIAALTGPGSDTIRLISPKPDQITYTPPILFLQSALPSINAIDSVAIWNVSISNTSNTSNAENTWLGGPAISGVSITQVYDIDHHVIIPISSGIYKVGTVAENTTRNFRITAQYTSCLQDSIILYSGWNCEAGYPVSVSTYPCTPEKITLKETPTDPKLDVYVTAPASSIELCDTATYTIKGLNIQPGTAYKLLLTATLPAGVSIVTGTSKIRYPVASSYLSISDPVYLGGTQWQWNVSTANYSIDTGGLKGIVPDTTLDKFNLAFKVMASCGFTSGTNLEFNLQAEGGCKRPIEQAASSTPLEITGATPTYHTTINLYTSYIAPCANNLMRIAVHNDGTASFGTKDSVTVELPAGAYFVSNSFTGIHNAPASGSPLQFTLNGNNYLRWRLLNGVVSGDSTVFSFDYQGNPNILACGDSYPFAANTTAAYDVSCVQSGTSCNINSLTGDTTISVMANKAYLSLTNGNGTSIPNPSTGETVTLNFDVTNTGLPVQNGTESKIRFYYDVNGTCTYAGNDVLLYTDSLLVAANTTAPYSFTFNVPAGQACAIIAIVDTSFNPCICNASQICIKPVLQSAGKDTSICSGSSISIGYPPITGYSYSWTPTTGLSNAGISNPVLTLFNLTNAVDTATYILTTNRIGCTAQDTVKVKVFPPLAITLTHTNAGCVGQNGTATVSVTSGSGSYAYLWNTSPAQTTATATGLSTGNYTVTVEEGSSCSATGAVTITQTQSFRDSIASIDNMACYNSNTASVAVGVKGTAPYQYIWSTIPTQTNAVATGLSAGTYYVTVSDFGGCSNTLTAIVTQPAQLRDSIVSSTNINCNGQNMGSAGVDTKGGTGTYSYLWSPVGGSNTTASGLSAGAYSVTVSDNNGCSATASVNITQPTLLIVSASVSGGACSGNTATANASGGVAPYTYLWSDANAQTTVTATGLTTGIYTIDVTDANGCNTSTSVNITQPAQLITSISNTTNVTCYGFSNGSATVNTTGGVMPYIYSWSPIGGSNAIASDLSAGTYTVNVIDANGCNTSTSVTITQPAALSASINNVVMNTACGSLNGSITVNASGGALIYSYAWSPTGGSNSTASGLVAGAYTITVTDANGCTTSTTAAVTQAAALTVSVSNTGILCSGEAMGTAVATTGGGHAPYTYLWSPGGQTNSTITGLSSGSYMVTVTDNYGCKDSVSTTITQPTALIVKASGMGGTCTDNIAAAEVTGGVSPYTYQWNPGGQTTATASGLMGGTYTATVVDNNGCSSTASCNIISSGTLPVISVTVSDANLCIGSSASLSATATNTNNSITWNPGGNTGASITVTPTVTTTYTVSAYNTCGAADTTVTINVNPIPVVAIGAEVTSGCYPLCVQFNNLTAVSSGNIIYSNWNFGNGDSLNTNAPAYCYQNAGKYSVSLTVISNSGCSATLTKQDYITAYSHPKADFTSSPQATTILQPTIQFTDNTTDAYGLVNWNWTFGDASDSSSQSQNTSHTYKDTGTYCPNLIVMNRYGCVDSITNCLVINPVFTLYIPSAFSPNGDGINDVFEPKGNDIKSFAMYVFDRWGAEIFHSTDASYGWDGTAKGILCQEDAYIYIITVYDSKNNEHSYTGSVNLLK